MRLVPSKRYLFVFSQFVVQRCESFFCSDDPTAVHRSNFNVNLLLHLDTDPSVLNNNKIIEELTAAFPTLLPNNTDTDGGRLGSLVGMVSSHFDESDSHQQCIINEFLAITRNLSATVEAIEPQSSPSNQTRTAALVGALDAVNGAQFLPLTRISNNDKDRPARNGARSFRHLSVSLQLIVIVTNKGPMLAGSFPDRPSWRPGHSCSESDGPAVSNLTSFLTERSTVVLVFSSDEEVAVKWRAIHSNMIIALKYFRPGQVLSALDAALCAAFLLVSERLSCRS